MSNHKQHLRIARSTRDRPENDKCMMGSTGMLHSHVSEALVGIQPAGLERLHVRSQLRGRHARLLETVVLHRLLLRKAGRPGRGPMEWLAQRGRGGHLKRPVIGLQVQLKAGHVPCQAWKAAIGVATKVSRAIGAAL